MQMLKKLQKICRLKILVFISILYLLITVSYLPTLKADIMISNNILTFQKGASFIQEVNVANIDNQNRAFVAVDVNQIINAGTDKEKKIALTAKNNDILVVQPRKLILQPGQSKQVRFILRKTKIMRELVFRAAFKPVSNQTFKINKEISKEKVSRIGIGVVVAYGALIFVKPTNPIYTIETIKKEKSLEIKNNGNVNVFITRIVQCSNMGKKNEECSEIEGTRLYPKASLVFDLASDLPVTIFYKAGDSNKTLYVE